MEKYKIVIAFVCIALILFAAAGYKALGFLRSIQTDKAKTSVKKIPPKTTYTFLLMGYGGGAHEGTYLSDTMMTLQVNTKKKTAVLISIPRDTWVKLPTRSGGSFETKINATYAIERDNRLYPAVDISISKKEGEGAFTKKVIQQISGVPIDAYIAVDFAAYTKIIDAIGGIDIYVDRAFTDEEYPIEGKEDDLCDTAIEEKFNQVKDYISPTPEQSVLDDLFKDKDELKEFYRQIKEEPFKAFPCRYEKLEFAEGQTHMDGVTALKYARSRHSDVEGGDFNRARRQQKVLDAIKAKLLSPSLITQIPSLMKALESDIRTDASDELIARMLKEVPFVNSYSVTRMIISTDNYLKEAISDDKQYILIPKQGYFKWGALQKDIQKLLQGVSLTPTPKLKKATKAN